MTGPDREQLIAALEAARDTLKRASVKPNRAQRRAAARQSKGTTNADRHHHGRQPSTR